MNKAKTSYRNRLLSFPKIVLTSFLFFGLLLFANLVIAQSSSHNGGQWGSVGGRKLISGEGHFSNKWSAATRYAHGDGKYWKNDEPTSDKTTGKKIPATHTREEVTKDVWSRQGQITVRGPGYLGVFMRSKGAGAVLKFPKSGKVFHAQGLGKDEWVWYHGPNGREYKWQPGEVFNADPTNPNLMGGWVPVDRTMTLDVWVYNPFSEWGIWGNGYSAPKSVEYEFWFFPIKGGKVIKVAEAPGKSVMDNIDTPPPGKIAGGVTTDGSFDDLITGVLGEVQDNPAFGKIFHARKVRGDVYIDRGKFGKQPIKEWDIVRLGNIIVTGPNSRVSLTNPDIPFAKRVDIEQNSRVRIVKKVVLGRIFRSMKEGKKVLGKMNKALKEAVSDRPFYEKPLVCILEVGSMVLSIPTVAIMFSSPYGPNGEDLRPQDMPRGPPTNSFLYTRDVDTIYRLTHDNSNGKKTVSVAEGQVIAVCGLQPETVLSVKAGEELIVDNDCNWQKSNLTTSDIQEITSLFPDVKKTTRLSPIADSYVYAYSYRNWNKANWGKYGSLGAGWNSTGGEKRTYLKFDLSGIDPKNVGKATLKLFHYHTGGKNSLSLGVYAVTSPWQEGGGTYHSGRTEKPAAPGEISWVNQPSFNLDPIAQFNPGSGAGKYIEIDITPLVMAWLTGKPNYGLMIKPVGIMSGRAPESSYGFYSRERQDKNKRPVLVLSGSSTSNTQTGTQHPVGDITKTTGTGPTGLTLDFETGRTNGWTKTGTAFDHQPTYGDNPTARHRGQPSKHVGNYWIGTYEKYQGHGSQTPGSIQGDGPTGTLTSNVFTIPTGSLSFLVGGGSSSQTRVELLVSGNSVLSVSGRGTETMHRVKWDLNPWAGQQGQIRLVDNASGGWGHINADDFRFSHSSPSGGTPGGIRIESATYGGNCGVAKGNVTAHIARQCNGKSRCRYVVNHKIIGDPAFGCPKTYSVQYRCGNNPQVLEQSLPPEAGRGDKAVLLECAGSSGGDIVKPDYPDGKVTSKCGLGKRWDDNTAGWTGVWLRRGESNVFDAQWTLGNQQEKAVLTINIHGNTVNVKRQQSAVGSSHVGQECVYKGTLAADNVTVTGTVSCDWSPGPHKWRATIRCDSGGDGASTTGSLPPSQEIKKVITGYGKKK